MQKTLNHKDVSQDLLGPAEESALIEEHPDEEDDQLPIRGTFNHSSSK